MPSFLKNKDESNSNQYNCFRKFKFKLSEIVEKNLEEN